MHARSFPSGVGMELGNSSNAAMVTGFTLQTHYTNVAGLNTIVDSSGIQVTLQPGKPQVAAGLIMIGDVQLSWTDLSPNTPFTHRQASCVGPRRAHAGFPADARLTRRASPPAARSTWSPPT